jgi:hypothetical protein
MTSSPLDVLPSGFVPNDHPQCASFASRHGKLVSLSPPLLWLLPKHQHALNLDPYELVHGTCESQNGMLGQLSHVQIGGSLTSRPRQHSRTWWRKHQLTVVVHVHLESHWSTVVSISWPSGICFSTVGTREVSSTKKSLKVRRWKLPHWFSTSTNSTHIRIGTS